MAGCHDSSLVYGVRDSQLVHVSEVLRGLECGCVCPICNEPLVAKLGDSRAHHFSHSADTDCTPNPESLTHRYAKELIAKRLRAVLPAFEEQVSYTSSDGNVSEAWARGAQEEFVADLAEVEYRGFSESTIIPDVFLKHGHRKLLVEVHFRHPVPADKIDRIKSHFIEAVEVNLNDLPPNCHAEYLTRALKESWRWSWLNNRSHLRNEVHQQLTKCHERYLPKFHYLPALTCAGPRIPSRKLESAARKMDVAAEWIRDAVSLSATERMARYIAAPLDLRLAVHCCYLRISPLAIPLNLMQKTRGQSILKEHPVYWQTWLFAKFCIGTRSFSARDVESLARRIFESLNKPSRSLESVNGFTDVTQLFYEVLLQFARQGLVIQADGPKSWLHEFKPRARTVEEAAELIGSLKPAISSNRFAPDLPLEGSGRI